MNSLMNSVSLQIQRIINEAINEPVLPELQAYLRSVNRQPPHRGWNLLGERPERNFEDTFSRKVRSSSRDELLWNLNHEDEDEEVRKKLFQSQNRFNSVYFFTSK